MKRIYEFYADWIEVCNPVIDTYLRILHESSVEILTTNKHNQNMCINIETINAEL